MSFEALLPLLPVLPAGDAPPSPWPKIGKGGASFSDDLMLRGGERLGVRVRVTDREEGGYLVDLRDSDPPDPTGRYALSESQARVACLIGIGHALGQAPTVAWASEIELLTSTDTWIGGDAHEAGPAATAFGMARTADAMLGALANAWPDRVGAGSCSVGAVIELSNAADEVLLTEVLSGGEGGRPDEPGRDAWPGLVLPSPWVSGPNVEDLQVEGELRDGSGGGGKHPGGRGIIRRYRSDHPLVIRVAFDRTVNPPHGIDRAGPPEGTVVCVHAPAIDQRQPVEPWSRVELPAGAILEVHTCGGAGWGFPGYGDIEWDPSQLDGKPTEPAT